MSVTVTTDLDTCFRLRHRVFVEEQGVPVAEEIDAYDRTATHLLVWHDGLPVGTARVVIDGPKAKIGRVCVLPEGRGLGLGAALIGQAVEIARRAPEVREVWLGAQISAIGFYEPLGFAPVGQVYDDAGIPHRDMVRRL